MNSHSKLLCATISVQTLRALCLTVAQFFSMTCWERMDYLIVTEAFDLVDGKDVHWNTRNEAGLPPFEVYLPVLQKLKEKYPNLKLVFEIGTGSMTDLVTNSSKMSLMLLHNFMVKVVNLIEKNFGETCIILINTREAPTLSAAFAENVVWFDKCDVWLKYDPKWGMKRYGAKSQLPRFKKVLLNTNHQLEFVTKHLCDSQPASMLKYGLDNGVSNLYNQLSELRLLPLNKILFEIDTRVLLMVPVEAKKKLFKYVCDYYTVSYQAATNLVYQNSYKDNTDEPLERFTSLNGTQGCGYMYANGNLLCYEDETHIKSKLSVLKSTGPIGGFVSGDLGYDCYATLLTPNNVSSSSPRAFESVFNLCHQAIVDSDDVSVVPGNVDEQFENNEKQDSDVQDTTNDQNKTSKTGL